MAEGAVRRGNAGAAAGKIPFLICNARICSRARLPSARALAMVSRSTMRQPQSIAVSAAIEHRPWPVIFISGIFRSKPTTQIEQSAFHFSCPLFSGRLHLLEVWLLVTHGQKLHNPCQRVVAAVFSRTVASACSRSARMSSTASIPTESRTRPSRIPMRSRCLGDSSRWELIAG